MRILISLLLFLSFSWVSAQQLKVVDSGNFNTLIGATVALTSENGTEYFLSTNQSGIANIEKYYFKGGSYLLVKVSYIGYKSIKDTLYSKDGNKTLSLKPQSHMIDDVVVTAQYSPTSIERSVHKVNVINRQKLDNMAAVNVKDALSNELNIRFSQSSIFGSGMSLQGMDGENVKILIDGVPVIGRLYGQVDLSQINLNDVERIEVIEGPLSVNYGSNALAGTINIITKTESKYRWSAGIDAYTESVGTYNIEAAAAAKLAKNHSLQFSLGRNYFDGWSSGDSFFPSFESPAADSSRVDRLWKPKEQYFGRLQYHFNLKDIVLTYKGEVFDETVTDLGYPVRGQGGTLYTATDNYYYTKRFDNAIFARGKINDNLSLNWLASYNNYRRVNEGIRKNLRTLESNRLAGDSEDTTLFQLYNSRGSIATTRGSTLINYEIGYDINVENAKGQKIDEDYQEIGDYAAFASVEANLIKNLIFKPAVRYSYNTKYTSPLTPSLNLRYARGNSIARVSYAKGFRAPSLKELYLRFEDVNHSLRGNADLKAEKSDNYSISFHQKFLFNDWLIKAELVAFYNRVFNQIKYVQFGNASASYRYDNIGESLTKGINLNFSAIYESISINLGGSYIGRYDVLSDINPLNDYTYSPEIRASATYLWEKPKITFSVFAKYQGELPGFKYKGEDALPGFIPDNASDVIKQTIEAYQLLDLTISKKFWKEKLYVALGCKNILGVENIEARTEIGEENNSLIPIGMGRVAFVKLGLNFNQP